MSTTDFDRLALQMPAASRPSLSTHQSSSLPSTPYQHARKLSFELRTPSPNKEPNRSPRSTHSESDGAFRPPGRGPFSVGCKYETGMAFSRRRIPYSVGGDKLERAKSTPKKYLNPTEEEKLSADMRELYSRLLPTTESEKRRAAFVDKLETILNNQWPGNDIRAHVFGSSGNLLCTSDSDVDVCITTPMKALEQVCLLATALADHGMERVVCVPQAKVPIVKIWDPELQLACDVNVNNTLALENTRMIKTYVEVDERVRPLAMIIKHWTKQRILNDAALGGTLSSYTWICMIINFLQTRDPPILPALHKRPHQCRIDANGKVSAFADDIESLRGFGRGNKETIGDLLLNFFRRYGHDIDYETRVISVREGRLINKEAKKWHLMQNNRLCVEEPFNITRNLGNTADDISFRGVHLELRRAFDLVSEAKLDQCCEQYVFPAIEEKIWAKPAPQPRPVLTRSTSQSGRGGKGGANNSRGGKHQHGQHRNGNAGRRASSAAAFQKFITSQSGGQTLSSRDYLLQTQNAQSELHDQLYQSYQLLQVQEQQLRMQLYQQAQAQAHAQLVAQGRSTSTKDSGVRIGVHGLEHTGIPFRNTLSYHPFTQPALHTAPQASIHTNPSSPSMAPAQPELRRGLWRFGIDRNPSNASSRSHSQPARAAPQGNANQVFPRLPQTSTDTLNYQHRPPYTTESFHNHPPASESASLPSSMTDASSDETVPREYVGYYLHGSLPSRPFYNDPYLSAIPSFHDSPHRLHGVSSGLNRLRRSSRSPSPSISVPFRDRSASMLSAASAPSTSALVDKKPLPHTGSRSSGPIIVDGSGEADVPDYSLVTDSIYRPVTMSEATSVSDDQPYDTPASTSDTPSQDLQESSSFDVNQQTAQVFGTSSIPRPSFCEWNETASPNDEFGVRPIHGPIIATDTLTSSTHVDQGESIGVVPAAKALDMRIPPQSVQSGKKGVPGSPTSFNSSYNRTVAPNIDVEATKLDLHHENPLKQAPYLSPVREVRTPSPTANRKDEARMEAHHAFLIQDVGERSAFKEQYAPYSNVFNEKRKQPDALGHIKNGQPVNGTSVNALPPHPSGWQQPSKKGRKAKSKTTVDYKTSSASAEPLPPNESERKGG